MTALGLPVPSGFTITTDACRAYLDIGCGTGFHLPLFAATARSVDRRRAARRPGRDRPPPGAPAPERHRAARLGRRRCPLPDASVDVMHARWAYFFGPGCEPGLAELDRVMRPGGRAFVIDNDPSRSTFGEWFRRGYPDVDHVEVARVLGRSRAGSGTPVDMAWTFDSREDLESVVRIEFARAVADEILAGHEGTSVDYAVNVWTPRPADAQPARWLERRTTREGSQHPAPVADRLVGQHEVQDPDQLDRDLLERLAHRGQPGPGHLGRERVVEARRRRCRRPDAGRAPRRRAARRWPRVSLAQAKRGDRRVLEHVVGGHPGGVDVVGDADAEPA